MADGADTPHLPREPLPTKAQLALIEDLATLDGLHDDVLRQCLQMEADLDFRSDGDLEWEKRCRRALAIHRQCLHDILVRIRALRPKGPTPDPVAVKARRDEKAERRRLHDACEERARERRVLELETARANVEAQRLAAEGKRAATAISALEGLSFARAFMRHAKANLPPETYVAWCEASAEHVADALAKQLRDHFNGAPNNG